MSGREHNDDSSGNLAASEPTVPEFTGDPSRSDAPDPNDTQPDPQGVRRMRQDQNVTNDPVNAAQGNSDTMEDPFSARDKARSDSSAQDETREDPNVAGKKVWADPLAPDETVQDVHGQPRKIYADPLAGDVTQQSPGSQPTSRDPKSGASASRQNTNWDPVGGTPAPPRSEPAKKKTGQLFSEGDLFARKYEIKGHIGQGGMGVVYKALDLVLGRIVAIKFLKGKSGIHPMEMSRFQQEAKAIASLDHTNIIRVHDMSVTDDGDPFFVLEYLDGHALSSEIRGKKQLPLERCLSIISQVCDALQHAHDHGVIHRDIKPSNLMVVPQKNGTESIKLLDFGIAKLNPVDEQTLLKLTKTGELFGSPHYMSPEQCTGKMIGATSDIYSLGCVLYEMICGVPPFSGQSALDTLDKHKNASLASVADLRKELKEPKLIDNLLDKMMAKEGDVSSVVEI
ncbi:MAG: serine/threonine-protein kinase [Candidatus Melainabacteria bacterium]|nr:serine/threonine-protein kinase [Candidatus Melainabacteria bacterium]